MAAPSSREWLDRLLAGDPLASEAIYRRYADRLLALTRDRLSPKLRRRVGAEDVLQSAFFSFFTRARRGDYQIDEEGDLWRLLAKITLNKLAHQARRHRARKRSLHRDTILTADGSTALEQSPRHVSASAEMGAAEELGWLLSQLDANQRAAVEARLGGATIEAVAARLGCAERTVRRWLAIANDLLNARWKSMQRLTSSSGAPSAWVAAPKIVGALHHADYRLEQLIGAGGVCKVYRARQKDTDRAVAVKVLRKRLESHPRMVQRFLQEVSIASRLSHRNIVSIHGYGRLPAGGHFLVMDLVTGCNLVQLMGEKEVSPSQAIEIVATIAEAIDHAHANGIVHRDLTPANVLVGNDGQAYVIDFGFAWLRDAGSQGENADPQEIVGAAGFIAPEQFDRRLGTIGPQTDVFGLGAILLFLIGDQSTADFAPLREIGQRCMQRNPSERPVTAMAVARELRGLARG